ncbi:mediator-associated protein [Wolffia australiana]
MGDSEDGYKPGHEFVEDSRNPLLDISLSDSTELWLMQWPINQLQPDDFDGKEMSFTLNEDGTLATIETLSGKSYDVVSFASQEPDATVFLNSNSNSKAVGKISRRVSLVRYPGPDEQDNGRPTRSSSQKSGVSVMRVWNTHQSRGSSKEGGGIIYGTSHDTLTSMDSMSPGSVDHSRQSKRKKRKSQ